MGRPTINDLAEAAGLSVSTVNRVIGGGGGVRPPTMQRVRDAAQSIGFYGLGAIEGRIVAARPKYRFGMLLLQSNRTFYQMLAQALKEAGARVAECEIEIRVEFMEALAPEHIPAKMVKLGE